MLADATGYGGYDLESLRDGDIPKATNAVQLKLLSRKADAGFSHQHIEKLIKSIHIALTDRLLGNFEFGDHLEVLVITMLHIAHHAPEIV